MAGMNLEKLVFDADGGVTVELKAELIVANPKSFLVSVPVTVTYQGERKEGGLTYDLGKQHFITALTDFFPGAAGQYNPDVGSFMARIYSTLLNRDNVKVREQGTDSNGQPVNKLYPTYSLYRLELVEREKKALEEKIDYEK